MHKRVDKATATVINEVILLCAAVGVGPVALALYLATSVPQGQTIECKASHQDAPLIGASVHKGPGKKYELLGAVNEVRGGQNSHFRFKGGEEKWAACWYKPNTPVWFKVDSAAKRCDLSERAIADQVSAKVICR
jgi:hypothetical protein